MSIMMTLHLRADGAKVEAYSNANEEAMAAIIGKAQRHGLIAHRFYSDGEGMLMVLDEWPDAESFQAFFSEAHDEIGEMMAAVGAQGEPDISYWHELRTSDRYGWGIDAHAMH